VTLRRWYRTLGLRTFRRIALFGAGLVAAACGSASFAAPSPDQGVIVNRPVPDVALTDTKGQEVRFSELRGHYVVLAPFLTLCQDECPLITAAYFVMERDVRAAGLAGQVEFVTVSVDPWRDSPARDAAFEQRFGANWLMLTGSVTTLGQFWTPFGVYFARTPEGDDSIRDWWTGQPLTMEVLHTDGYILIDPTGKERFIDSNAPDLPSLRPDLKALLDRGGLQHLEHPLPTAWTVSDAIASLEWLTDRNIPQLGS
jgi:protein SCO1